MIFFTILKVIGWILLIVLGVVLVLFGLILFVPLRYRLMCTEEKQTAKISWLFHLIRLVVHRDSEAFFAEVRILFFRLPLKKTDKAASQEQEAWESLEDSAEAVKSEACEPEQLETASDESGGFEKEDPADEEGTTGEADPQEEKLRRSIFFRGRDILKNVQGQKKKLTRIWQDERNRLAFQHMKKELFYLFRHYGPRRADVSARFSLGSPDYTGIAAGIVAMFPIVYRNDWEVYPDFESDRLYWKGMADVRGRMRMCHFFVAFVRILFDQNIRRMRMMIHKLK